MNQIITQTVWNNNHPIKITEGHPGQCTDSCCSFICKQCNREVNEYLINGIDQGTNQTGMCVHCLRSNGDRYKNCQSKHISEFKDDELSKVKFTCTTCRHHWIALKRVESSSLPPHECQKCGESKLGTRWSDGTGGGIKYEMIS